MAVEFDPETMMSLVICDDSGNVVCPVVEMGDLTEDDRQLANHIVEAHNQRQRLLPNLANVLRALKETLEKHDRDTYLKGCITFAQEIHALTWTLDLIDCVQGNRAQKKPETPVPGPITREI